MRAKQTAAIPVQTASPSVEEVLEEGLAAIGREVRKFNLQSQRNKRPLGEIPAKQLCSYVLGAAKIAHEKREASKDDSVSKVSDAKLDAMLKRQLAETYGVPLADLVEFLESKRSARVS